MSSKLQTPSDETMHPMLAGYVNVSHAVVTSPAVFVKECARLEATENNANPRYTLIDALRGIAAIGVLLHHLLHTTVMEGPLRSALPQAFLLTCTYGAYGVQIFFVLSGFVIAHSLRNNALSWREVKNFIIRRQIRLDPPYWVTIIFALLLFRLEAIVPSLTRTNYFRLTDVFLNFVYLQNIVGVKQVVGVAWTLCIEVQFYLAFILLLKIGQRTAGVATAVKVTTATVSLVFLSGICSLTFNLWTINHAPITAWFVQYWFHFVVGVLCYWSFRSQVRPVIYYVFLGLIGLSLVPTQLITSAYHGTGLLTNQSLPAILTGGLTSLLLYMAGRKNKLTVYGTNRILLYFGKISYSLYLVHLMIVSVVLRAGYKLSGNNASAAVFWFMLAATLSIACAHLLHKFVEQPSMRFATDLKRHSAV